MKKTFKTIALMITKYRFRTKESSKISKWLLSLSSITCNVYCSMNDIKQFEILSLKWGRLNNWLTKSGKDTLTSKIINQFQGYFGITIWSGEGGLEMRWKSQWGQFLLEIMIKH